MAFNYHPGNALDFSPLQQGFEAVSRSADRANALDIQQKQNARADEQFGMQKETFQREKKEHAFKTLAATLGAMDPDPARRAQQYAQVRGGVKDFDDDVRSLGGNPDDIEHTVGLITAKVRGPVDPLQTRKTEADIANTQAQTNWYNERPRTAAGGATTALIDRLMADNPGMSLEQAVTIAKRGAGVMEVGNTLRDRNTGAVVSDTSDAIAGAKRAEKVGSAAGESQASLAAIRSKMPGLEVVVGQLDELSEKATYTLAGQAVDSMRRQAGAEPRESAIARKQYISMVDNQILPMLRDTFGAQFTQKEGESLKATMGDPDASPKEKQAVLKAFIEQKRRNVEAMAAEAGASPAAPPQAPSANAGWSIKRID